MHRVFTRHYVDLYHLPGEGLTTFEVQVDSDNSFSNSDFSLS